MENQKPKLIEDRFLGTKTEPFSPPPVASTQISRRGKRSFLVTAFDASRNRLVSLDRTAVSHIEAEAMVADLMGSEKPTSSLATSVDRLSAVAPSNPGQSAVDRVGGKEELEPGASP